MKKVFYIFLGLIVIYLILALFGPSEIKIERSITINRHPSELKEKLGNFKYFHDSWSPWTKLDPAMITTYKGNPGETGHFYSWSGNDEVGEGEMEITQIGRDTIYQRLSYNHQGDSKAYFVINGSVSGTKVTWGMIFPVSFLGRTPMLFMNMDEMIGKHYEEGLNNLKIAAESETANTKQYQIKELLWEESHYLGRKESVSFAEMDKYFETSFGMLEMVLEKEKIPVLSAASGLYFSYDEVNQRAELSCAFKVAKGTRVKGWETFTFPASKVLCVEYIGDPANSGEAHKAIDDYIKAASLEYGMVIEEYLTDPKTAPDKTKWETKIYYLLK